MKKELKDLEIGDFIEFVKPEDRSASMDADISLSDTARWYCVVVRPGCHNRAALELARIGYRSFYPRTRRWISHARTKVAKESPILGRYLFVEVDHPRQSFNPVVSTFEIESMVSVASTGNPTPFASRWIESLLRRYLAGEWDEVTNGNIPVGARIKIVEGEFNEQCAIVLSSKGPRLNVKILGKKQETQISQVSVRAA